MEGGISNKVIVRFFADSLNYDVKKFQWYFFFQLQKLIHHLP